MTRFWHTRAFLALLTRVARVAAVLLCALVVGALPGSVVRPVVLELAVPPLPPSPGYDAVLDVLVQTAASHGPIAGAHVEVLVLLEDRAYLAGARESAADGHAHLEKLPRGPVWVFANAPGMARGSSQLVLGGDPRTLLFELSPARKLDVDVVDDRGAAVVSAEVEVVGRDPLPVGGRADAGGHVIVNRLDDPPWIVTTRAPGFEEITRRGVREGPVHVILRKLGALLVTVLDLAEAPIPGARVQIAGTDLWPARSAEVGKEGHVRIGSLAAGSYALRATAGESASPIELGVLLDRGEEKALTLHVAPGRMIAVRVTESDAEDAAGVLGARVSLAEAGLSPFPLEASTNREGRARLGPIAPGPASIAARAEGFVTTSRAIDGAGKAEVRLALVRAGTIVGRVVDARGFPVDGATLEIVGTDPLGAPIDDDPRRARFRDAQFDTSLAGPRPLVQSGELGVVPGPVPPIPRVFDAPTRNPLETSGEAPGEPWVTRSDGSFRLTPVSPGRVRALVHHPQFVDASSAVVTLSPGREARLDVVMHAGGSLEGRVVDAGGHPVGGARIVIAAASGSMERASRSASDGTFAFAAVPGAVTLTASRDGGPHSEDLGAQTGTRVPVDVPEGGVRTLTITLPDPRPSLPVHVTDDRGYPVDAAQVSAFSLEPSLPLRVTAFTDARGEAALSSSRGMPLRVEVRAPGHAVRTIVTDASLMVLEVALRKAETATGVVRAARGGDPIVDADVALYADGFVRRARTDRGGAFTLVDLAPGPAELRVRAEGHGPARRDVVIEAGGLHATTLSPVELTEEGVITGTVVDARGDPVAGARVARDRVPTYLVVGATPPGIAVTDARGRFRLGELLEGTITLEAYAADVGRKRIEGLRVTPGRTTDGVKITLQGAPVDSAPSEGTGGGVAVTLGETSGDPPEVVLVAVAEASEAERAGLQPGDAILAVDGAAVHSIEDARTKMNGPLADDVLIKIRRGERVDSVRIAREPVRR